MRQLVLALAVLLVPVLAVSAEDKKEAPKKGQLPANWAKLGLSEEQKQKVYSVQAEFREQIAALKKQLAEVEKKESAALAEILTDGQKTRLKEIYLEKVPGGKDSKPATKPSGDKPATKPGDKPVDKPAK